MQIAKKWKSAIALFLAVVMAISFAPSIDSKADIIPPITGLSNIANTQYQLTSHTVTTTVTVTDHDYSDDYTQLRGTLVDSNGDQVSGSTVSFGAFSGKKSTAKVTIPAGAPV